jgi:teichuronic acid biosynthesis glycosyltransferase TuaC
LKDKLRVAIVTPVYPNSEEPYRGIFNYRRAKALSQFAEVEVFCTMAEYPRLLRPATRAYHKVDAAFTTPGLKVHYVSYPAVPILTRPLNGYNCSRALLGPLREFRPDAILAYWIFPEGYGAVLAGEKLDIPVIVKSLGSDLKLIPDAISKRLLRATLRKADYVLTVSNDLQQIAIGLGANPARIRTIHNGCDASVFHVADRATARAELGVADDAELILFVGRLVDVKGIGELLEASRRLVSTHPKLRVACIGEGVLGEQLRAAAGSHVDFLGRMEPAQIARWMAASNLLCLPSYSEGCPNALLESLFCGRPIVASNVGGIPEVVDDGCAILVPPRDPAVLAAALDQALSRKWDEAAIARSYGRSWDDVGRETFEVCTAVMK